MRKHRQFQNRFLEIAFELLQLEQSTQASREPLMRHLKRTISTLLLVVLAPALVMAAQSKLCVGDNGHKAIEFALTSSHEVPAHVAHQSPVVERSESCTDFDVLDEVSNSARAENSKLRLPLAPAPEVADLSGSRSPREAWVTLKLRSTASDFRDSPLLQERRTVLLRI